MPIYEYQCPKCENVFEEWLKVSEAEKEQACPSCGELAQRFVSQTSFVLKGGGWYVTEYGKNSASHSGNKNATPAQSPVDAKTSSNTDSSASSSSESSTTSDSSASKAESSKSSSSDSSTAKTTTSSASSSSGSSAS